MQRLRTGEPPPLACSATSTVFYVIVSVSELVSHRPLPAVPLALCSYVIVSVVAQSRQCSVSELVSHRPLPAVPLALCSYVIVSVSELVSHRPLPAVPLALCSYVIVSVVAQSRQCLDIDSAQVCFRHACSKHT